MRWNPYSSVPAHAVRESLLALFREARFETRRPSCLHCSAPSCQRWGRFAGRQRYRCKDCGRTFSDLTHSPFWYCKRLTRWPVAALQMEISASVRRTAAAAGVSPTTAFRWRHVILGALARPDSRGRGIGGDHGPSRPGSVRNDAEPTGQVRRLAVAVGAVRLRSDDAGTEPGLDDLFARLGPGRYARHQPNARPAGLFGDPRRHWILIGIGRDRRGSPRQLVACHLRGGPGAPSSRDLSPALHRLVRAGGKVTARVGRFSPLAIACRRTGLRFRSARPPLVSSGPLAVSIRDAEDVALATREAAALRRWVRRFRGFKPGYVDAYLAWYVRVDPERDELDPRPAPTWARRARLISPWSAVPEGMRLVLEALDPGKPSARRPTRRRPSLP